MAEYQQIVDEIREFLAASDQTNRPELAEWAAEYVRLCREVNDRLRQCRECLQKGLRTEAIHLAEKHPPVLDLFAALDFAELPQWKDICLQYALPEPPPLAVKVARAVTDAYAEEAPLQHLLAAHRMLNVAQAPATQRAALLRKIAAADPATPYWDEDLKAVEGVRHHEMRREVEEAIRAGDTDHMQALLAEVAGDWRNTPPAELQRRLGDALQRIQLESARQRLDKLLPDLGNAYSAQSADECRALLAEYDELISRNGIAAPAEAAEQVEPVRAWVSEEDQRAANQAAFEAASAALQRGLDADLPTPELERLHRAAMELHLPLYKHLEQRYRARLHERAVRGRRRFMVTIVCVAASLLIVLSVGGLLVYSHRQEAETTRWTELAEEGQRAAALDHSLDKARAIRRELAARAGTYLAQPTVAAAVANLDTAIAQEDQRATNFAKQMGRVQSALAESPDLPALDTADSLAATSVEKATVAEWRSRLKAQEVQRQQERDRRFSADVDALRSKIEGELTAELLQSRRAEYIKRLAYYQARAGELQGTPGVSAESRETFTKALTVLLTQCGDQISKAEQEQARLNAIAQTVTVEGRVEAIKAYLGTFPSGTRAASFDKVLQRADEDRAIEAWAAVVVGWRGVALPTKEEEAVARIQAVEKFEKAHAKSAIAAMAREYRDYLTKALDGIADDGPWRKGLKAMVNGELANLSCVQTTTGLSYFVPQDFGRRQDSLGVTFNAYLSTDLRNTKPVSLDRGIDLVNGKAAKASASPQQVIAQRVREKLNDVTLANWTTIGLAAAEEFAKDDKMHPVLKGIMLQRVLQLNQDALEWAIGDCYKRTIDDLAELSLADTAWMDPTKAVPVKTLDQLKTVFATMKPTKEVQSLVDAKVASATRAAQMNYIASGVLLCKPGDTLTVHTPMAVEDGLVAEALVSGETGAGPQVLPVARVQNGHWVVEEKATALPEGSQVFVRQGK